MKVNKTKLRTPEMSSNEATMKRISCTTPETNFEDIVTEKTRKKATEKKMPNRTAEPTSMFSV